jgi:hypothetical protein
LTSKNPWPPLPFQAWRDTYETLHMWTQIVGKIRLALAPRVNHWWHVTLYVTARGLTTSPMPCGERSLEVSFDFIDRRLRTDAAFYAYAAPEPAGFRSARILPEAASYNTELGEYILMYDDVRTSASPRETLLQFLESTYEAGASLGQWNRGELEVAR